MPKGIAIFIANEENFKLLDDLILNTKVTLNEIKARFGAKPGASNTGINNLIEAWEKSKPSRMVPFDRFKAYRLTKDSQYVKDVIAKRKETGSTKATAKFFKRQTKTIRNLLHKFAPQYIAPANVPGPETGAKNVRKRQYENLKEAYKKAGITTTAQTKGIIEKILAQNEIYAARSIEELAKDQNLLRSLRLGINPTTGEINFDGYTKTRPVKGKIFTDLELAQHAKNKASNYQLIAPDHITPKSLKAQSVGYPINLQSTTYMENSQLANARTYLSKNPDGVNAPGIDKYLKERNLTVRFGPKKYGFQEAIKYMPEKGVTNIVELNLVKELPKYSKEITSLLEKRVGCADGCLAQVAKNEPGKITQAIETLPQKARGFLSMLGRGGVKAAPYAAVAAAGAIAEPLVKQFRNDDPTTYMTDPDQQKGVLLSLVEAETPQVDEELLKWQYPGIAAGAAAAIPGSGAMYKARRLNIGKPKMGMARAALGPVGKVLAGSFSPLAVAASLPIGIAAQIKGGAEIEDIATDPFNWMGPAFASSGAKMATRGMPKAGILSKALRMGMSPAGLRVLSRGGIFGLLAAGGLKGYDIWENSKYK